MSRNYLNDEQGDLGDTPLAVAGFKLRKMLQRIKAEAFNIFVKFIECIFAMSWNLKFAIEKSRCFLRSTTLFIDD